MPCMRLFPEGCSLFLLCCPSCCCLARTLPDKLVKLKAHMELFHGMQMFEQALPSREDLAKKYALGA